jgi:hypothetical protein
MKNWLKILRNMLISNSKTEILIRTLTSVLA